MKGFSRFAWPARIAAGVCLVGGALGLASTASAAHSRSHAAAAPPVVMNGYKCNVVATAKHRHAVGHAGQVVCGVSGNDTLKASGPGRVVLIAGPGKDKLVASKAFGSQDTLIGGTGPDTMVTGTGGDDVVEDGSGNDTIDCPGGGNTSGGTGNTGTDQSGVRMAPSQLTVVGADAGDTEDSNCSGDTQNSAQLEFQGSVNTTDGSTTMNITVEDHNDAAQAWLDANGDPTTVDIALTSTTSIEVDGGGSLAKGDDVEVAANPSSTTLAGSTLTAVDVQAESPGNSGFGD